MDSRLRVEYPWVGTMRVSRHVSIHHTAGQDFVVTSATPGVVDEELTLEMVSGERVARLRAKVLESRPVVVDGSVRHRVRLVVLDDK
jgi:hypothetical protein